MLKFMAVLFLVLQACVPLAGLAGETIDRVAARINGELVTEGDLKKALSERGVSAVTPESVGWFFDRTLLLQDAKRQKIDVSEEALQRQVEEAVRGIRGNYKTDKDFRAALAEENLTLEKLKANLLKRARTDLQVFKAVTAGGALTDEMPAAAAANESAENPRIHLRRLGVPVASGGAEAASARARELVLRMNREQLSFEEGVRRYSAVPEAKHDGGDMGWMELSGLAGAVAEAVRNLKPGQASAPVVAGGYANIFYVEGKRSGRALKLEERFNAQRQALLERLRKQAQIEIYSHRVAGAIPREYAEVTRNVTVGGTSAPHRGPTTSPGEERGRTPPAATVEGQDPSEATATPVATPAAVRETPRRGGLFQLFRRDTGR